MENTKKILYMSYSDYDYGDDDQVWFYEYSNAGLNKALEDLYKYTSDYFSDRHLYWSSSNGMAPKSINDFGNYICYSNDGEGNNLYFFIEVKEMFVSPPVAQTMSIE